MRALSVRQPFAEHIARGVKLVEYRTWRVHLRGPLLIVASKLPHEEHNMPARELARLPFGEAVCVVELYDVTGEPGEWEWHLRNPRRVKPFAVRGWAAIYTVPDRRVRFA